MLVVLGSISFFCKQKFTFAILVTILVNNPTTILVFWLTAIPSKCLGPTKIINPSQKEGAWCQQSYYNPTQIGGKRDSPITILGIWLPLVTGRWISMSLGLRFPINRHNPSVLGRLGLYFLVARRTSLTILPQSYPNRWQINGKPHNPITILVIRRPF